VRGYDMTKGGIIVQNYLDVTPATTKIFTTDTVKGFAVGNVSTGTAESYLKIYPSNYFVGHEAGKNRTTGHDNSIMGYQAGYNSPNANYNTFMGYQTGANAIAVTDLDREGSSNIFIGCLAGADETGSNKLYIDNSRTADPLIYGDFTDGSEKFVFNENVGIKVSPKHLIHLSGGAYSDGATWTNSSDANLKENFETINGAVILS
jgi:hypothetical protein